jgi:hypothetical protein
LRNSRQLALLLNQWAKNNNFCVKNNSISPIDYQTTTIQSKSKRKSMKKMIVEVCAVAVAVRGGNRTRDFSNTKSKTYDTTSSRFQHQLKPETHIIISKRRMYGVRSISRQRSHDFQTKAASVIRNNCPQQNQITPLFFTTKQFRYWCDNKTKTTQRRQ